MTTILPRHVICVLGNWRDLDEVDAVVRQEGAPGFELDREFSQLAPDDRMMASFDASYDRVSPSMTEEDVEQHSLQGKTRSLRRTVVLAAETNSGGPTVTMPILALAVPLFDDGQGGLRVTGTRVLLERIVHAFED